MLKYPAAASLWENVCLETDKQYERREQRSTHDTTCFFAKNAADKPDRQQYGKRPTKR